MKKFVIVVAGIYLVMCSPHIKTDGDLVCPTITWGIVGGNLSIDCQSNAPLWYGTLTKLFADGKRANLVTVDWENNPIYYNDSNEMEYNKRVEVRADMPRGKVAFIIQSLIPNDSGPYELSFKTKNDTLDRTLPILANIVVPPAISESCKNSTFVEGHKGFLSCNVSGSKPVTITWYKGNSTWNGNNLILPQTRRSDQGWYQVVANKRIGNTTLLDVVHVFVTVAHKPDPAKIALQSNKRTVFYRKDEIAIICRALANPPADYMLYCNNKLVQNSSLYNDTRGVFAVQLAQTGLNTFICVPFNELGSGQNQSLSFFVRDNSKEFANSEVKSSEIAIAVVSVVGVLLIAIPLLVFFLRRRS